MKKSFSIFKWSLLASLSISLFSCNNDDGVDTTNNDDTEEEPLVTTDANSKYIVALQSNADAEGVEREFLLEYSDIESLTSGTITAEGQGIPQIDDVWNYVYEVDNSVFSVGTAVAQANVYRLNEAGDLEESTTFTFASSLNAFSDLDGETLVGLELSFGGYDDKGFFFVDADQGTVTNTFYDPIDTQVGDFSEENPGATPWVTGVILRDDKLFVSYYKFDGLGNTTTPDTDRAYVAVYDYSTLTLEKLIEDERTSPIGTNGHSSGIIKTENDDIYSFSASSLSSGFTAATKPAGILKIANGETEFDTDYFFDVENATNGGKIFWMDYVENGKALARIVIDDTVGAFAWGTYFGYESVKLVVLDFENQTVTNVSGMENHLARYTSKLFVEDGIAYLGAETGTSDTDAETAVYAVDVETAIAKKGAVVDGKSIKGIFKISN